MPRILSIDIGIRNFAYCIIDIAQTQNPTIVQWEKIDLLEENKTIVKHKNAKHVPLSILNIMVFHTLHRRLHHWRTLQIDTVLMEQQIGKSRNAKMEGLVAMWLFSYLGHVILVSSKWKLEVVFASNGFALQKVESGMSYDQRKQYTVHLTNKWIPTQSTQIQSFFASFKGRIKSEDKQDDLADCLMQAIAWFLKRGMKKIKHKQR